jgi:hypothetical protein
LRVGIGRGGPDPNRRRLRAGRQWCGCHQAEKVRPAERPHDKTPSVRYRTRPATAWISQGSKPL